MVRFRSILGHRSASSSRSVLGSQDGRAAVVALIAGYVDCYYLLNYHAFASFMSGNTTQTGLPLGQARLAAAGHTLLPNWARLLAIQGSSHQHTPIIENTVQALMQRNFQTDFSLQNLLKDAHLIDQLAQQFKAPVPAFAQVRETVKAAANQGFERAYATARYRKDTGVE